MKIFISSARKGLEEERDSLRGLILALGHTPVQFEDFSAQATPSREACLSALASADACVLLLGPNYGHIFPESGQSATHDEWVAAQAAGMPRLVYRKQGVTFEPAQHAFARIVEAYATGVFRDSFGTTAELQTKIVQKIKELESGTPPLAFTKLTQPQALHWSLDDVDTFPDAGNRGPLLELHALPLDFVGYSARELEQLNTSLVDRIRATEMIRNDIALHPSRSQDHAAVGIPANRPRSWNTPQPGELVEVRLYKSGQISIRATLPRDGMGSILAPNALPQQIADLLRFTGALNIVRQDRIVVAAGVSNIAMTSVDTFHPQQSRQSAQLAGFGRPNLTLRTQPDESVTLAALGTGADEVASYLAQALITQHPSAI
ncbi:DUF4062 domain-containing protein [Streptomyces sp. NPDC047009]|uniref:DUF4062 domain-containing protein n=1 Tax=Streptomyces sp. NPDC047009 TaxID=3154496 RepID=UPI0033E1834A